MNTSIPASGAPIGHYVSGAPFDPLSIEKLSPQQEKIYLSSQWRLMWLKFRKHRVAVVSLAFLIFMYATIFITEFLAPYHYQSRHTDYIRMPPQGVHLIHNGELRAPFVYSKSYTLNIDSLKRDFVTDTTRPQPLRFFCKGDKYIFWGLFASDKHLVCAPEGGTLFLLGTDRLGRDMLSRMLYGARISLTVGLIGITISFILGIIIGGLAGYYGGTFDLLTQRLIEILQSLPHMPLWLALSAILPATWSPVFVYFGITIILGLLDWTGLARAVRSKLLSLREEDYVVAAQLMGAKTPRIIGRHLVPGFMSHLIASATLTIPKMILGETALSFLGLGLRSPVTSWGVMLNEAQNINVVAIYPWLLFPVIPVILVVLAFSFVGDGLRDAADPYSS